MRRFIKIAFCLLIFAIVSLSFAGLVLWKTEALKLYSVQTDSMAPVLQPGDLAVSFKPTRLQTGDIISYRSSNNSSQIVSHRLVKVYPDRGYVITKGDNLTQPDPAVPISSITAKTALIIPRLGYAADLLKSPAGLIGFIYLPALALSAYELSRLIIRLGYRPYGLGG